MICIINPADARSGLLTVLRLLLPKVSVVKSRMYGGTDMTCRYNPYGSDISTGPDQAEHPCNLASYIRSLTFNCSTYHFPLHIPEVNNVVQK